MTQSTIGWLCTVKDHKLVKILQSMMHNRQFYITRKDRETASSRDIQTIFICWWSSYHSPRKHLRGSGTKTFLKHNSTKTHVAFHLHHTSKPTYLGVVLDGTLTYRYKCEKLVRKKLRHLMICPNCPSKCSHDCIGLTKKKHWTQKVNVVPWMVI